ncbi:class II D-tagatose-bisphosphate aldolase non-catalytic subunit [Cesiribacter sp. SM1]|uniref:class II D-tagatose-bisphosphate aldolase non-catalytic subunit n=1 Tax=Cesiribacter sp. SM1 TaxID=2861196 RepID=UPI001CD6DA7C|nr:class II D-tagatose-bisphosphate aldolase, non-catalytic subunit [Cesiribacter sp. SM1]
MNQFLRETARQQNMSLLDYVLKQINASENETGVKRTIFAACPNSLAVIKASLRSAKRNNAMIKFAATLNQVDSDGGYTGLTQEQFVRTIRREAAAIHYTGPVIIAIDHGGPWLKDVHNREKWSYERTLQAVKESFEAAIAAGYDLIHVDPTIDITLPKGEIINIDVVAERTIDLIAHAENFRRSHGYPPIAYEVGTEEVHGGLADMQVFDRFLRFLKEGLQRHQLEDVWPCFVVGKVGTDLHTSTFDPEVAKELTAVAQQYGSVIKGHYSDNVTNPEDYPRSGMGAANVGPEFTEREYEGLMELCEIEDKLLAEGNVAKSSNLKALLWKAVIDSQRWKKWMLEGEDADDFYANSPERQEWLIKTGCRYIWENPEVLASRWRLYRNLDLNGVEAEEILLSHIEKAMDKYFYKFNLVDLNDLLLTEKVELSLA